MGGFRYKVMWREWRQVFFSCFCSGSRAHANTKLIFLSINTMGQL